MMKRKDATGQTLKIGDIVRVMGVPDLNGMVPEQIAKSLPVFEYLVGKYKRIEEFDRHGFLWLTFRYGPGRLNNIQWVALEPYLVRLRRKRNFPKTGL